MYGVAVSTVYSCIVCCLLMCLAVQYCVRGSAALFVAMWGGACGLGLLFVALECCFWPWDVVFGDSSALLCLWRSSAVAVQCYVLCVVLYGFVTVSWVELSRCSPRDSVLTSECLLLVVRYSTPETVPSTSIDGNRDCTYQ